MINFITQYFQQAELALAAYANLNEVLKIDEYIKALELDGNGMSTENNGRIMGSDSNLI